MAKDITEMMHRLEIEDRVVRMFVAADERDWPTLRACFTDPFTSDMTSMTGGTRVSMTPEQVAKSWSYAFELLDHVHHQIGTMLTVVEGSTATLQCYGGALHHRDGVSSGKKTRQYVGTYKFKLVNRDKQWLINEHKFVLKFIEGNPDLEIDN